MHKQVYIYGGLDTGPTMLTRNFGMAWGVGGWLLTPFLQSAGAETIGRLRARVAAELTTTFASTYTREVSLAGMLEPDAFNGYVKRATGEKFLADSASGSGAVGRYKDGSRSHCPKSAARTSFMSTFVPSSGAPGLGVGVDDRLIQHRPGLARATRPRTGLPGPRVPGTG